jgi:hypothetical protein
MYNKFNLENNRITAISVLNLSKSRSPILKSFALSIILFYSGNNFSLSFAYLI